MPQYDNARFQPPPPIRTATSISQKSQSSRPASPDTMTMSPTSPCSPASPASASFLGALSAKMMRSRSKSPPAMPPEPFHFTAPPASHPPCAAQKPHTHQSRHVSSHSQSSVAPSAAQTRRSTPPAPSRRSTSTSSDMWRGRHANSWLFNDFSITETASKAWKRRA